MDAHQGNGHERDLANDPDKFILDMYNKEIYPHDTPAKRAIDLAVEVRSGIDDAEYMQRLQAALRDALSRFRPDLIIYNAGTDCLDGDPLGCMCVSEQGVIDRDEAVFAMALQQSIPIVMLLSGGYQKSNAEVIAKSIRNLDAKFGLFAKAAAAAAARSIAASGGGAAAAGSG